MSWLKRIFKKIFGYRRLHYVGVFDLMNLVTIEGEATRNFIRKLIMTVNDDIAAVTAELVQAKGVLVDVGTGVTTLKQQVLNLQEQLAAALTAGQLDPTLGAALKTAADDILETTINIKTQETTA
jgi:hypothetical protein